MTWHYFVLGVILILMELSYFRLARRYHIMDLPVVRSSHQFPTVRGGGIVFILSIIIWSGVNNFQYPWFILGVFLVAVISFFDDLKPRHAAWRVFFQIVAVMLMFQQISLFLWPWWLFILALIVSVGALNAFNFMDGINGMTGLYALANLTTFAYINMHVVEFSNDTLIWTLIIAVLIFLFFNFRKRAVCFAGDVGSVTIAFIQIFFLISLIQKTDNFFWVILFLVYGFDSVVTIVYRLKNRENIFKPHRTHLYQYLSNEFHWSHRFVSILYMVVQMVLNAVLVYSFERNSYFMPILVAFTFVVLYLLMRVSVLRKVVKLT